MSHSESDPMVDVLAQLTSIREELRENSIKMAALEAENNAVRAENAKLLELNEQTIRDRSAVRSMPPLEQGTPERTSNQYARPLSAGLSRYFTPGQSSRQNDPPTHTIGGHPSPTTGAQPEGHNWPRTPPLFPAFSYIPPSSNPSSMGAPLEEWTQRLATLESRMNKVPGVVAPPEKTPQSSFADSPFSPSIAMTEAPPRFAAPIMKLYDGTEDPEEHVAHYKQKMFATSIPLDLREACMCKGFGSTLTGPALQWYISLPNGNISSFAQLVDTFLVHFSSSKKIQKCSEDLFRVVQRREESTRDFVARFNKERVSIPRCNPETAFRAFKNGLLVDRGLYEEIAKYDCQNMEDALARATIQIRWEEDARRRPTPPNNDREKRGKREEQPAPPPPRNTAHSRPFNRGFNRREYYENAPEYNLSIAHDETVLVLKKMGEKVKWPLKNTDGREKDTTKWCGFHQVHGHKTTECKALLYEVNDLVNRGHLHDLLTERGKALLAKRKEKAAEDGIPEPTETIAVIIGGSEISGISHSAAKRSARAAINPDARKGRLTKTPSDQVIMFTDSEATDLLDPHHDALVISIQVANCIIKRVLIDNGSSANVLMLSTLKKMNIDENRVVRRSTILIGFGGEQKFTEGEIALPVYAGGVNCQTKFLVLDCHSPFNIILGRPWIHEMKAVPSTYHQVVKFPTAAGIKEIYGEQLASRECYQNGLKKKKEQL
ncbi:uncharacterized protein LOC120011280 [Tripterygium wilfordii]|uniref:uncharacterized protein LOC120011280 n=1 Tax=Tripterygium wilfordii TaxID=458696 RepID=UPI0018F7F1C1|nr:uncharacterized protein LOC120011280 [Tripterygium wilfordii]